MADQVDKLKLKPKIVNGKPVEYTTTGTIEFRLSENQ